MLINYLTFFVGLLGACLISVGAWLIAPEAGLIVAGCICVGWSLVAAKAYSVAAPIQEES